MSFLRTLESLVGMFQCLLGMLVSGLVVFFPVMRGGSAVRVRGLFVKFGCSYMRITRHSAPILGGHSNLVPSHFLNCPIMDNRAAVTL